MNPLILSPAGLLSFHTSGSILTRCVGRMGEFWNRNFGGKVELDRKKEFRVSALYILGRGKRSARLVLALLIAFTFLDAACSKTGCKTSVHSPSPLTLKYLQPDNEKSNPDACKNNQSIINQRIIVLKCQQYSTNTLKYHFLCVLGFKSSSTSQLLGCYSYLYFSQACSGTQEDWFKFDLGLCV